jgi:molybdenum cofactor biosynthesis enzyme MoaA
MKNNTLLMMPFKGKNVPHIALEVNHKCNISCKACYKRKLNMTKPLEQIKEEIDFACRLRNIRLITIAGGEPVLHPQLPEIISYITGKGIIAAMLSNGYGLTDELLIKYKKAGLKEILLHIDVFQNRSDARGMDNERQLNSLRSRISKKITKHGIFCTLALTIYQRNLRELPHVMNYLYSNPDLHSLFITCCTNVERVVSELKSCSILGIHYNGSKINRQYTGENPAKELDDQTVELFEVENLLSEMGRVPFAYVPSSHDIKEKKWLLYCSFAINFTDGRYQVFDFSSSLRRIVSLQYKILRLLKKPYSFDGFWNEQMCIVICILYAITSLSIFEFARTIRFLLFLLKPGTHINNKTLIFQALPRISENGEIVYCRDCPDATVKNGVLVPVCLADLLHPPNRQG